MLSSPLHLGHSISPHFHSNRAQRCQGQDWQGEDKNGQRKRGRRTKGCVPAGTATSATAWTFWGVDILHEVDTDGTNATFKHGAVGQGLLSLNILVTLKSNFSNWWVDFVRLVFKLEEFIKNERTKNWRLEFSCFHYNGANLKCQILNQNDYWKQPKSNKWVRRKKGRNKNGAEYSI